MTGARQLPAKWLSLYLLLVVFVVFTLATGGWLNHQLIVTHRNSIQTNREWVKRLMAADELARQASLFIA